MDYQSIIQNQLNNLLNSVGQDSLDNKILNFALDDHVSYKKDWTILKSNIIESSLIDKFLQTIAEERSWIHADLISIDDQNFLITIRAGAKVGNPNPAVNVSLDYQQKVKIITK